MVLGLCQCPKGSISNISVPLGSAIAVLSCTPCGLNQVKRYKKEMGKAKLRTRKRER